MLQAYLDAVLDETASSYLQTLDTNQLVTLYSMVGTDAEGDFMLALQGAYPQHSTGFRNFLEGLPTGEVGPALNHLSDLSHMSFAGLDLTGLSLAGKTVYYGDFAGSTITGDQLSGATNLQYANFSGLDLTGFDPA